MSETSAIPATSSTSTAMYPPCTFPTGLAHSAAGVQVASLRPSAIVTGVRFAGLYRYSALVTGSPSLVDEPEARGRGHEQVVETPGHDPPEVHRHVDDDFLELLEA